ncbi:ATP-binding cassette domain-containing protein [Solirubrobacter sp. CPCC 204708]|uniref:ATP-binding cassette domain-containing protein n=1 Tax=Solirubrobacter deserti TaxID=2282478 RepID=A0ABT4RM85_9ACTN|nr:ATP-binding cassette domain-containing protein [Solirubrobacter deserti]MBE2317944.1 ATP-binding cassette domain-containing protein [Solirubrobacter deserti]MDA0139622.1 ATP-binding cassette domain-containing protein [Solirubrobacter deserti]
MVDARKVFVVHETASGNVVSLQGASLQVDAGELVAVMGPSGSGKSTLLNCLAGLQPITAGTLRVGGPVATVAQDAAKALGDDQAIGTRIALRARLAGTRRHAARARAAELLARVGLEGREHARRAQLSGGEQQRAALCVAIAARPKLLLVDEVTGQLDAATGRGILALLKELAHDEQAAVLLATHDPRATEVADRTVTIRDGRVTGEYQGGTQRRYVFVDDGGLLRLDPDDLKAAGIAEHAEVSLAPGAVILRGTGNHRLHAVEPPERAQGGDTLVRLEHVRRRFVTKAETIDAVAGVHLAFKRGAFHALVGPSGCGKTSLLHLIAGLDRPDHGRVTLGDLDLTTQTREQLATIRRDLVAVVPQVSALVAGLSVLDNVALGLRARGVRDAKPQALAALTRLGLQDLAQRPAAGLSGGERQRVALARALATRAPLIVADEPTANLDEANAIKVAELLADTAAQGACVVCATHDASVTARATTVIAMRDGKVAPGAGGAQAPPAIA